MAIAFGKAVRLVLALKHLIVLSIVGGTKGVRFPYLETTCKVVEVRLLLQLDWYRGFDSPDRPYDNLSHRDTKLKVMSDLELDVERY